VADDATTPTVRGGLLSKWTEPEEWARLVSRDGCPICRSGHPTSVIAELETSWVAMGEEGATLPGSCSLFFRRHAIELHDLTPEEAAAYMRDIRRLSRAIKMVTGAVKMNYEVHGNTIPHLHIHFFPRYVGDPFEGGPINPRAVTAPVYRPGEFEQVRRRIREALGTPG
jgi:diadenosine tetraphosphate (Ap4A) HIT family hydrolase